eukprot:m.53007 g.53007  ORF g.53007 m.53007 type:complete len:118 (-) comp11348_c1_seq1:144-497(-)
MTTTASFVAAVPSSKGLGGGQTGSVGDVAHVIQPHTAEQRTLYRKALHTLAHVQQERLQLKATLLQFEEDLKVYLASGTMMLTIDRHNHWEQQYDRYEELKRLEQEASQAVEQLLSQ